MLACSRKFFGNTYALEVTTCILSNFNTINPKYVLFLCLPKPVSRVPTYLLFVTETLNFKEKNIKNKKAL